MDRRDALKKMAATGVVVSGASAIASSTAFADGGTPNSLPDTGGGGTVTFVGTPQKFSARIEFSIGTAVPTGSCPKDPTTPPRREYRWDGSFNSGGWRPFQPATVPLGSVSNARITVTVRWICGGNWKCESYTAVVSSSPAGRNGTVTINGQSSRSTLTVDVGSQGSGQYCDSPPPS